MGSLFLSECVDGGDSVSVSARDAYGSSDAAIPAATSLSPSRRLMWPSELLAAAAETSFSFMQISLSICGGDLRARRACRHLLAAPPVRDAIGGGAHVRQRVVGELDTGCEIRGQEQQLLLRLRAVGHHFSQRQHAEIDDLTVIRPR